MEIPTQKQLRKYWKKVEKAQQSFTFMAIQLSLLGFQCYVIKNLF